MKQTTTHTYARVRNAIARWVIACVVATMIPGPTSLVPAAEAASSFRPTIFVNTEAFLLIDDDDTTANVVMRFGDTLAKTLTFNRVQDRFEFNDDVYTSGKFTASGTLVTESGAYIDGTSLVVQAGSNNVGIGTAAPQANLHVVGSETRLDTGTTNGTTALSFIDNNDEKAHLSLNQATGTFDIQSDGRITLGSSDYVNLSGTNYTNIQGSTTFIGNNVGIGTTGPKTKLDVVGAISGSFLYATKSFSGAGLSDCDTAGTSKLLWDASTGRFSCGTDTDTNTTYTAGQGLNLNGANAFALNATVTGSVIRGINSVNSSGGLVWEGKGSGASLHIKNYLSVGARQSGSLLTVGRLGSGSTTGTSSSATLFSTDQMALGQLQGGAFFGRTGLTENQWGLSNQGNSWSAKDSSRIWTAVAMSSDGKVQTAVEYTGQIYTSSDYGNTWSAKDSNRNWRAVAMSGDGKVQTAVEHTGQIYTSSDYGNTWSAKASNKNWFSVAMSTDGKYQTAGEYNGQIYVSSDYGNTWTAKEASRVWISVAMSSDGKVQTATAGGGLIYVSFDYGQTWTARGSTNRDWFKVAMSSDGKIQTAVAQSGQIYVSYDYGSTWTAKESSRDWRGLAMSGDGRIQTAAEFGGQIYASTDYGQTWTAKDSSRNWRGLAMSSDGKVQTAVVQVGLIYVSHADSYQYGSVAIGTGSVKGNTKLMVQGILSGVTLYATKSFSGAGLSDCDGGTSKLLWDATTGRFSCGTVTSTAYTAGQGLSLNGANAFSLGQTISGTLLEFQTVSGAMVYAERQLSTSGSTTLGEDSTDTLMVWATPTFDGNATFNKNVSIGDSDTRSFNVTSNTTFNPAGGANAFFNVRGDTNTNLIYANASTDKVGIGTNNPDTILDVIGTISGITLYATKSFSGAGLSDCDTAGTSKLLWDATTGRFSCGTDTDTNTTYTAGQGLSLNGTSFRLNTTVTGAVIQAANSLASSGSLSWKGTASGSIFNAGGGSMTVSRSGATVFNELGNPVDVRMESDTDANAFFLDGSTDNVGIGTSTPGAKLAVRQTGNAFSANTPLASFAYYADRTLQLLGPSLDTTDSPFTFVTPNSINFRVDAIDALTIDPLGNVGVGTTLNQNLKAKFSVTGTISGATVYATQSFSGAGLTSCSNSTTSKLLWNSVTGRFSCGTDTDTDTNTTYTAGQGLNLNGTSFRLNTTVTGAVIQAGNVLASSGALTWKGAGSGQALNIGGGTIQIAQNGSAVFNENSQDRDYRFEGDTDANLLFTDASTDKIGIGTATPKSKFDVVGTISGVTVYATKSFSGAGLTDCDTAGTSKLLWDATTGRFSCGTDQSGSGGGWSNTGSLQLYFDNRYVNTAGDTMTGTLVVQHRTALSTALKLVGSGSHTLAGFSGGSLIHAARGNPTIAGTYNTSNNAYAVTIAERYAYVADEAGGLKIVDIGNPASPSLIATAAIGSSYDVSVVGQYAYVANSSAGLTILNISNPAVPIIVGNVDTSGTAYGIAVAGQYAYVADSTSGLQIVDISNPAAPRIVGTYDTTFAWDVVVSGRYAYVADDTSGIRIIEVSNAAIPRLVATLATNTAQGIAVTGRYVYVADEGSGLRIVDVSNPTSPSIVGSYNTSGQAWDVAIAGRYAYVADGTNGTVVIDISNVTAPTLVGTTPSAGGSALGIAITGRYAYTANEGDGLYAIDVNGLETPALTAGTVEAGQLSVRSDGRVNGNLVVDGSQNIGNGLAVWGQSIMHTVSGAALTLSQSGSKVTTLLHVKGAFSGASIYGIGLSDCDTAGTSKLLWDATTGRFSCGTDQGSAYTAGQGLTLAGTSFKVNSTLSGSLLRFLTVSGSTVFAKDTLTSSGTIILKNTTTSADILVTSTTSNANAYLDSGTNSNAGVVLRESLANKWTILNQGTTDNLVIAGDSGMGTDDFITVSQAGNVGLNSGGSVTPKAKLAVAGTISGTTLYALNSFSGAGLTSCSNGTTDKLLWNSTTGRFSCGTDQTGTSLAYSTASGIFLKLSGGTMTGTLNVQSGNSAAATLATLVNVRGTMSGKSLTVSGTGATPLLATDTGNKAVRIGGSGMLLLGTRDAPTTVPANTAGVFAQKIAGRPVVSQSSGATFSASPFQAALYGNQIMTLQPGGGTTVNGIGTTVTNDTTVSHPAADQTFGYMTNFATAATSGDDAGTSSANTAFFRGSTAGANGFFFAGRVGVVDTASIRVFSGMADQTISTMVSADNPAGNYVGFSFSTPRGDTNWQFITKDNSTQNVVNTGLAFTANKVYDLFYTCTKQCASITWEIRNVTDGTSATGTTSSNLPTTSTALRMVLGVESETTTAKNIRMQQMYCEADR